MRDRFEAIDFLYRADISDEDRERLAHGNAEQLLKIPAASAGAARARSGGFSKRLRSSAYSFQARTKSRIGRALISLLVK
jgi:hypothetical protein